MYSVPTRCPVCGDELIITRLHCSSCETTLEGRFSVSHFAQLAPEQLDFIETFVRCEGKITRMEAELSLSYPTIRNRLHEVIRAMGYEPGKDEPTELTEEQRQQILDDLDAGKISADEAMRLLRGEDE
ncbi:MAG: DUF2089 domain-containing protein [Chloroflexi bacterium]|nr:DUF2089 domain-containing protein [Chloroflexota bacterium]